MKEEEEKEVEEEKEEEEEEFIIQSETFVIEGSKKTEKDVQTKPIDMKIQKDKFSIISSISEKPIKKDKE